MRLNIHHQIGGVLHQNIINGKTRRHSETAIGAMANKTDGIEASNDRNTGIDTNMAMSQGIIEIMMNGGMIKRIEINS